MHTAVFKLYYDSIEIVVIGKFINQENNRKIMRAKYAFAAIVVLLIFAAFGYAVSTVTATGYAIYNDGRIFSGVIKATIKETGDVVFNSTSDGRFILNFTSINLTSGNVYTLIVLATDNQSSSTLEKTFVAD